MSHPFDRYAPFTDLALLKEYSSRSLRKSLRANLLRCTSEELKKWGSAKGWEMIPVPWVPEGFFVDREDRSEALGKDLFHLLGYTYMQEASSMLPVALLDPKPGEKILDMSSAPGSKTTQIASRIGTDGVIVANDVQDKRVWSLVNNLHRSGVTTAVVTKKVGQWFGGNMTEVFDRVLCDAPCTAQGTARKDENALSFCSAENIGKMAKLQKELLESAIHACKVGGRIVYSTCTLTPEENEGVILSVLNKFSDQISALDPGLIVDIDWKKPLQDSLQVQEYLSGQSSPHRRGEPWLSPTGTHFFPAVRLWPQTFDTEGFFVCVLEKKAPTKAREKKDHEMHRYADLPAARTDDVKALSRDWYGAEFLLPHEVLIEGTKDQLMAMPESLLRFPLPTKAHFAGLPFGKIPRKGIFRLSHEMAALRGHEATKQRVLLSDDEWQDVVLGRDLAKTSAAENGDVLFSVHAEPIGRELTVGRGMKKDERILNRMPRDIVRMFS